MKTLPRDVQNAIDNQGPKFFKKGFDTEFNKRFQDLKNQMIQEFLTHPVTIEIKNGPKSSNISGTLGGVSNLFSFIGFPEDYDPIDPILKILERLEYRNQTQIKSGWSYTVMMPKPQDIFAETPMPWAEGRSWAKGIESGISGLGFLIRKNSTASRSGAAVQGTNKVRGGKYKPVPYISRLINKYNKEFSKLK
jgi:hypothetical protein